MTNRSLTPPRARLVGLAAALLGALAAGMLAPITLVAAQGLADALPPAAWPTSPFHGQISGATGQPIPCRCRFKGGEFKLGETVCMNTHLGVQLARCDLFLNNTSWVPIGVPCSISRLPSRAAAG